MAREQAGRGDLVYLREFVLAILRADVSRARL